MNVIEAAKKAGCNDEFIKMAPDWLERFAFYIREEALAKQYPGSGALTKAIQERARAEMKEECAKALEDYDPEDNAVSGRGIMAAVVRSLK